MCLLSGLLLIFGIFAVPMIILDLHFGGALKYMLYSDPSHLCAECLCLYISVSLRVYFLKY
jgi:hypothetical protein